MMMEIKLDEATIAAIKQQAVKQVLADVMAAVMKQIDPKQIAAEVRNNAVKEVAKSISGVVMNSERFKEAEHRAIQAAESRVNAGIGRALAKGITINFKAEAEC